MSEHSSGHWFEIPPPDFHYDPFKDFDEMLELGKNFIFEDLIGGFGAEIMSMLFPM